MTEGVTVDRGGDRPLYVQVCDAIAHQIDGRTLLPGEALPSEAELQRVFGVARSVVRQALACLVDRGAVDRAQGRVTIVAPLREWHRRVQQAGGFEQQLAARGQTLTTQLVSLAVSDPPERARAELDDGPTWRVERLRSVEGEPILFVRNWVPCGVVPHLTADLLSSRSLHDLMREAGCSPRGGRRHVQAVPADESLASMLHVAVGDPLLLLQGATRDGSGRGLEWFNVWHRGDTVFDVDAAVEPPAASDSAGDLDVLKETARRLASEVDQLNAQLEALG